MGVGMRYVCYREPDEHDQPIRVRIPVAVAIERQRAKGKYDLDEEALLDFLAENWARVEETT
jgi:hypothetical protein